MIETFRVGAVFELINRASPELTRILKQVRELSAAIEKAKTDIAGIAKMPSLGVATTETRELAVAWREVGKAAASANRSIGLASKRTLAGPGATGVAEANQMAAAWERIAVASAAARGGGRIGGGGIAAATGGGGGGGGGGRHRPGWLGGGGGMHVGGPSAPIPGGGHVRFGGGAAAAAGLLGYGAYEAAEMEDAVFQLIYHSGQEQNPENRAKFRKVLQDSMIESGYGIHDIAESAKQEIRMFQGTKGGGLDVLPEMLRAATIEARLKGESPEASMKALIGLAHMTKQYDPAAIRKLAPAFAFLSTADPRSLSSIERAAGYAVPLLQSGLEIDPMDTLLLGTALARGGATNTKSGTWLREMMIRAMPGTSMMSKMAFKKHEEALKAFGLVDDDDKPTFFTNGKPDPLKMLDIAGARAAAIPVEKRAAYERGLFGAQGGGGFALLADPAVHEQILNLRKMRDSTEFRNRYGGFSQAYTEGSTVQQARTAMQEFNVTMMDLGAHTLPTVNRALRDIKSILEGIRGLVPGANANGGVIGARAIEGGLAGAAAGAAYGAFGGPVGAVGGAVIGGVGGVALGYLEQQARVAAAKREAGERAYELPASRYERRIQRLEDEERRTQPQTMAPPIHLNLNIDGRALATAVSEQQNSASQYTTDTPASNGTSLYGP